MTATPQPDRLDARALAQARLDARRRRILRIRRTVVALAAALFLAAFSTLYVQLAAGRDPSLSASATRTVATASSGTSGSAASTTHDDPTYDDDSSSTTSSSQTDQPSAVTTQQS
jgi:hypothetical protein